jgi:glycine/D-amino acid oxidase-like deaminating enzyme
MNALVIGGGIFGVTAARALRARGHAVTLVDPGPLPHPLAESTDLSKIVRVDYGADAEYTALGERALEGWRKWNAEAGEPLFVETGVAFLARAPLAPGGFEHESFTLLSSRGHRLERLDAHAIASRFPAFSSFVDGYFNPSGGWARAGAVVAYLAKRAIAEGVEIRGARVDAITERGAVIDGERASADLVVVCAGAWTPKLLPELAPQLRAVGQPVFHLRPRDPALFASPRFPVFGADLARTGYYGFPLADGVVKIANHGVGIAAPQVRTVTDDQEAALRKMVTEMLPALADAPIVFRRLCVYSDTHDEHFWIARHPERAGLAVATGGSGHAFKFAPVLGELIATLALGEPHALAHKFRWRTDAALGGGAEAARFRGEP